MSATPATPQWIKAGAFSAAVHGGLVAIGFGLTGLTEPARPDPVITVELIFAPGPSAPTPSIDPRKARISVPEPEPPVKTEVKTKAEPVRIARVEPPRAKPVNPPPPRRKPPPPPTPKPVIRIADIPITGPKTPPVPAPVLRQASITPPAQPTPENTRLGGKAKSIATLNPSSGAAGNKAAKPTTGRGNRPPRYPYLARKRGWQGRVVLLVRVAINGKALSVRVKDGSGYGVLDRAARKAVESWRFTPARLAGIPVVSVLEVPVVFRLK